MTPEWLEKQKELGIDVSGLEGPQEEELSMQQYEDFMVWHRGLAVPAARNLDKPDVRRGRELFNKLGCAGCHKPEWTTGEYKPLPGYANQTIRPYTDMLRHDMGEINRGRSRFWRTPPLWGRGLICSMICAPAILKKPSCGTSAKANSPVKCSAISPPKSAAS